MSALLRFMSVTCVRGDRRLFDRLDLALDPGGALLVTGANGSGKSSLLRIAAGLLRPQAGTVERSACGLSDDLAALDPELPLAKALRFWAQLDDRADFLGPAMADLGIAHLRDVPVRMLSAGQLRRATLARLVAGGRPLWLLDEPFNGLDGEGIASLSAAIAAHRQAGGAVLVASHLHPEGEWQTLVLGAGSRQ